MIWHNDGAMWVEQFVDVFCESLEVAVNTINGLSLLIDNEGNVVDVESTVYKYHVKNFTGRFAVAVDVPRANIESHYDDGTTTVEIQPEVMLFYGNIADPENETKARRKLANLVMNYINNELTTLTSADGLVWREIIANNTDLNMFWPFSGNNGSRITITAKADIKGYLQGV